MSNKPYQGRLAKIFGTQDLLRPTPARLGWLLLGLLWACALGFALGLIRPRFAKEFPGQPPDEFR